MITAELDRSATFKARALPRAAAELGISALVALTLTHRGTLVREAHAEDGPLSEAASDVRRDAVLRAVTTLMTVVVQRSRSLRMRVGVPARSSWLIEALATRWRRAPPG